MSRRDKGQERKGAVRLKAWVTNYVCSRNWEMLSMTRAKCSHGLGSEDEAVYPSVFPVNNNKNNPYYLMK